MAITVAIAGGAGNIGKSISDALVASGKYRVILLGRQAPKDSSPSSPPFVGVDYNNVDAVTKVLEEYNVHTVISAIKVITPESGISEVNLINAAAKAAPTKRFMQSEWGVPTPPESIRLPQHQVRLASVEQLRKTDLEWTQFHNGYFLDYYGMPYIETHIMEPVSFVFDIPNRVAAIPGTGDDVISFTYTRDIAQFVVKALELPKWEEELYCYGDKKTFNQFLKLLEEATGSKFKVTYDSKEKLEKGEVTELPSNLAAYEFFPKPMLQMFFSRFGLYILAGLFDVTEDKTLNKIFPDVKTTTVEDVVGLWKGK
ncbi:nmra-like family [Trichoderma arundinaceum]|uniref:Nmra-like family n=1 Tax=Trichoderma arundinaceum TaxID=490622 RepID=A0A395NVX4_TRIAR|nr:nmra-like family [Trichoderma arundinaceum]